jgi:hypothetical protein
MLETSVKIDLTSLRKFKKDVTSQEKLQVVYKKWAVRYRSFVQIRFDKASKGDGTWDPLADSTIAGRRNQSDTILRDTGVLFNALTPVWVSPPGGVNELLEDGVRIGFGGNASHPSGLATIAEIASFHQEGKGNLPQREIIVEPPQSVIAACVQDLQTEITKLTS